MMSNDLIKQFTEPEAQLRDMDIFHWYMAGLQKCLTIPGGSVRPFLSDPNYFNQQKAAELNVLLQSHNHDQKIVVRQHLEDTLKFIRWKFRLRMDHRLTLRQLPTYHNHQWDAFADEMKPDLKRCAAHIAQICVAVKDVPIKVKDCKLVI